MNKVDWITVIALAYCSALLIFGFSTGLIVRNEFCQENGFDYHGYYNDSSACWRVEEDKLVVKQIDWSVDFPRYLTFQFPYDSCVFAKEIQELN